MGLLVGGHGGRPFPLRVDLVEVELVHGATDGGLSLTCTVELRAERQPGPQCARGLARK